MKLTPRGGNLCPLRTASKGLGDIRYSAKLVEDDEGDRKLSHDAMMSMIYLP